MWDSRLPEQETGPGFEIHRSKGRLVFDDGPMMMLQGVQEIFELTEAPASDEEAPAEGKIILIGRGLDRVDFEGGFRRTVG